VQLRVRRGAGHKSKLTILCSIATAIAHKTARRNPVHRRPDIGANDCHSAVFRSWRSVPASHRRGPRPTGRYQDRNGGVRLAPETRAPRTALRARRFRRGRNRRPQPAAPFRRRCAAEPGPARPAGAGREPPGPAAGLAFRLPIAWASCAHLPTVPCLRWARPQGTRFRSQVGTRPIASSCIFQCRPLAMLIGGRRGEAGSAPAFSLLRSALLASRDPHG
jgi:hypothetical protein